MNVNRSISNRPDPCPTAGGRPLGPNLVAGVYVAGTFFDYCAVAVTPGRGYVFTLGNARNVRNSATNPPTPPFPAIPPYSFVATTSPVFFQPFTGLVGQVCTGTLQEIL